MKRLTRMSGSLETRERLSFGPYYHITNAATRQTCIRECVRVLKPGGYLAIAYINKYSVVPMLATRDSSFLRNSVLEKVIDRGTIVEGDPDCFWTDAHFSSPDEMESIGSLFGLTPVDHVGTDGISHTIATYIDALEDQQFDVWLHYHFQTCKERSILGMSTHGLFIGQK